MTQLSTIIFHNQSLLTIEKDSIVYTAIKPICENIGLNWDAQRKRIQRDEVLLEGAVIMTVPTSGGLQEMTCLPIDYLNGWLFGIDVKRVKPEIKDTLILYKKECYKALHDYWHKPKANVVEIPSYPKMTRYESLNHNILATINKVTEHIASCYVNKAEATQSILTKVNEACGTGHISWIDEERLSVALHVLAKLNVEAQQHRAIMQKIDNDAINTMKIKHNAPAIGSREVRYVS